MCLGDKLTVLVQYQRAFAIEQTVLSERTIILKVHDIVVYSENKIPLSNRKLREAKASIIGIYIIIAE